MHVYHVWQMTVVHRIPVSLQRFIRWPAHVSGTIHHWFSSITTQSFLGLQTTGTWPYVWNVGCQLWLPTSRWSPRERSCVYLRPVTQWWRFWLFEMTASRSYISADDFQWTIGSRLWSSILTIRLFRSRKGSCINSRICSLTTYIWQIY